MRRGFLLAALVLTVAARAEAQDHYALEILAPRDDLPTHHRMTRAYPGMPWEVRVAAVGGDWPYTYSLAGQPSGMTIVAGPCTAIGLSCTAGTISWPSPDASDSSITVKVCDRDNDCVSETWGVTVSASGFRWIDAKNGNDSHNGILVANGGTGPVQTMSAMQANDTGSSIWIFRAGNYNLAGVTTAGARESLRTEWEHDARGGGNATMWECYPGESCSIDIRYPEVDPAPSITWSSELAWLKGFTVRRDKAKAFEWKPLSRHSTGIFYKNTFQEGGPGQEGANAAFIGTASNSYALLAQLIVQNNTLGAADHVTLKLYSLSRTLIEGNVFAASNAGLDVKSVIAQYTIRANTFIDCDTSCISGNMDEQAAQAGVRTQGEVHHNVFNGCGARGCIYYAEQFPRSDGEGFGPIHAHHNTFVGVIHARDVTKDEGVLRLTENVIINAQKAAGPCPAKVLCTNVTDFTKIVLTNNLTGVAGDDIIDGHGDLQGRYLTAHGPASATPKGHMLAASPSRAKDE